ncbi:hypothetical protein JI721_10505 [Alicyclobacillus cycloheptanicus]|uniref:Uncharacterized protein YneR n=1 Tax=Alicyclobacillus cycloheptanicus TaxID=1457 RepID=A0ABT9XFG3_9BACL|nr:hypothetical protein [Alicyclobacillus cycloheptanicus]MDQ0189041.1 uncharacterized protein YneR [Alicyclobacillus cycloheptanicus]WDM00178.1 hypothetical protein JI721_10505 [Alicyclobacillus cycloheptanicus]
MKISVTETALQWFQSEWGFTSGDHVRVFVRYGGDGGFSLGVGKAKPDNVAVSETVAGIYFFVTADDAWYLNDKSLRIDYDEAADDIVYQIC